MAAARSIVAALSRKAVADRPALIAPLQGVCWSYAELHQRSRQLARGLEELGVQRGAVVVSDAPNTHENLLLQLALWQLGSAMATVKDMDALGALRQRERVDAAVCASADSFLTAADLPIPPLLLGNDSSNQGGKSFTSFESVASAPPASYEARATEEGLLGVFNGTALKHGDALAMARDAAAKLSTTPEDRACVSITLCHAFGIGSAAGSALVSGAAVVLPAVGGIRGCGNPTQRADATLDVMQSSAATQLFADKHTLAALPAPDGKALSLRCGVVKIGSGSDFLDSPSFEYAGAPLLPMGKQERR